MALILVVEISELALLKPHKGVDFKKSKGATRLADFFQEECYGVCKLVSLQTRIYHALITHPRSHAAIIFLASRTYQIWKSLNTMVVVK
ncbi:hypothetical protein L1987_01201 [Smallanthus sonchifolius]|uniref:Uncharacterized protein n=1 Tax=Smallanthus sonchifolius TaxID=185202 RepID=A0ACB9K4F7_9ASTR|nr:hypothetical protein L1987_01201 [Smallanthus sonchifolius]